MQNMKNRYVHTYFETHITIFLYYAQRISAYENFPKEFIYFFLNAKG